MLSFSFKYIHPPQSSPSASTLTNFTPAIGDRLYQHFRSKFDAAEGGFGGAPKFPTPVQLDFLLRHATYLRAALIRASVKDKEVAEMSVAELRRAGTELEAELNGCVEKMEFVEAVEKAMKGKTEARKQEVEMVLFTLKCGYAFSAKYVFTALYDFYRKSTVLKSFTLRLRHVPHFEKMLYDQAQLLSLYITAYTITKEEFYAEVGLHQFLESMFSYSFRDCPSSSLYISPYQVARDIIKYVDRDLSHPDGGFYSAEDADSYPHEGAPAKKEGAFCVWERSEINAALPELEANVFSFHYGVRDSGNVDATQDPHGELTNKNVLIEKHNVEDTASKYGLPVERIVQILKEAKQKLWEIRATKRPKPHLDDKILTSWNGLMISGLTQAYSVLDDKHYLEIAVCAANFIKQNLYNAQTHILTRSYREGPSEVEGFLDDYSYLIQALLDLYEATFDEDWLQWAVDLQERQNELFWDATNGGYFSVTEKDKSILVRMKDVDICIFKTPTDIHCAIRRLLEHDGAEPSGYNHLASFQQLRLSFKSLAPRKRSRRAHLHAEGREDITGVPHHADQVSSGDAGDGVIAAAVLAWNETGYPPWRPRPRDCPLLSPRRPRRVSAQSCATLRASWRFVSKA
ncbi:Six-hairpin glycosidase-like protein [Endogone sp. FLAS-F59071]|nr:Six-hairpin glycosidase-like protein [Endogone sp. FLAS-F59071]|eukprot:RUS20704.1 Six-hairpin glycosidase-like protein [Endogone sp. FLAS-F59071]